MLRLPAVMLCATVALAATPMLAQEAAQPAPAPTDAAAAAPQETAVAEPDGIAEGVAALVNDDIVSTYDLRQRMLLLIVSTGVRPTEQNLPQIEREALRSLVDERLQLQELARREVPIADEQVDAELEDVAKQANLTSEQLTRQLGAQGVRIDTLREQLKAELGWRQLIRGLYGSRLKIGEDQVKQALARYTATAGRPQYRVSEIFIDATRVGGQTEALNGATQLITQIQGGAPFAAVARQFSASPTAAAGGDAGWLAQGELPAELEASLAQMQPGQMSQPIPVQDGVYILALREKRDGAGVPMVNLRQIALRLPSTAAEAEVQAAQTRLETLRPTIAGCADMEAKAATLPGAVAGDLGETALGELSPAFRTAAERLNEGQISAPIRTTVGLHLIAVCSKRTSGEQIPTATDVENRLFGQQLAMLSRRFLRDLRSEATIESR